MIRSSLNLGPKSEAMLAAVGVNSLEELRQHGAIATYLAVKRTGAKASLNLLWALEGAITGRHWQEVARDDRLHLLTLLEQAEGKQI